MIKGSNEGEDGKKEGDANDTKTSTKPSSSTSSSWLRLKDPRIVRVSRAFGGKDRHSKVCTVRGLRDRRVRLSVPTAIQLYDLQDRLGLNQPSKVVDWLLNVAKDEIDELPPLPMHPLSFSRNLLPTNTLPQVVAARTLTTSRNEDWDNENNEPRSNLWTSSSPRDARGKSKEDKSNNCSSSSLADFLTNPQGTTPHSSLYQWEPNLNFPYISRLEDAHYNMSLPSTLMSLSSSYFPGALPPGIESRQMNQMLSSGASLVPNSPMYQPVRPFHLSMSTPRPPENSQNEQNKDQELHQFPSE